MTERQREELRHATVAAAGLDEATEYDPGRFDEAMARFDQLERRVDYAEGRADALGLAITHAHAGQAMARLAQVAPLQRRQHAMYRAGRSY